MSDEVVEAPLRPIRFVRLTIEWLTRLVTTGEGVFCQEGIPNGAVPLGLVQDGINDVRLIIHHESFPLVTPQTMEEYKIDFVRTYFVDDPESDPTMLILPPKEGV